MNLIATIYSSSEMDWKIRVGPKRVRSGDDQFIDRPPLTFWSPTNAPDDRMLIYNPKISLTGRSNAKYGGIKTTDIYLPVTYLYAFANRLQNVYDKLNTSGLFKKDGAQLFVDGKTAAKVTQKLPLFNGSILIVPVAIPSRRGEDDTIGIQFLVNSDYAGTMKHWEVREFCEILRHTDIQTFSLILSMVEKLDSLDGKLDTIQRNQEKIIKLLEMKQTTSQNDGLVWSPIE